MTLTSSAQSANRAALVAALRSGQYVQTRRCLADAPVSAEAPSCFCVIGLACELSGLGWWRRSIVTEFAYVMEGGRRFTLNAPDEVEDFYGFSPTEANDLVRENDKGATFEELADFIEALPPPSDDEEET